MKSKWVLPSILQGVFTGLLGTFLVAQPAATPPAPPSPPIISPEVSADHHATFRLRAPNAKEVLLGREGAPRQPMQKDEKGLWTVTIGPLEPDYYGYSFVVDGVSMVDPSNPMIKPN